MEALRKEWIIAATAEPVLRKYYPIYLESVMDDETKRAGCPKPPRHGVGFAGSD